MAVTVGVICAIPQELAYLRGVLVDAKRQQVAQILFDSGQLDAHRVVLAAAGMGKVNTGLTATLLADRFGCRTIVFTGVAGGLDPELCIGDIVIADRVVQHDSVCSPMSGCAPISPDTSPSSNRPSGSDTRLIPRSSIGSNTASTGSRWRRCPPPREVVAGSHASTTAPS